MSIQIQIGADISGVDKAIDQVSKSIDKIKPAAANGAASLNALSQVARDAPFGFIAIQNNLPILFDQFGNLTKASGGLSGAFKALGASLSGPAGVTFALGAVVSLLTVVAQKYGSIGGALDAFIGKTVSAKDIQDKFNASLEDSKKASAGEIANLDSLVKILNNVNSTRDQQVGAFDELNKKYPAILTNIKLENVNNAQSIALIGARTKLIKDQIILEGRREALIKLIGESALEGEKALNKLTNRNQLGFFESLGVEVRGLFAGVGGLGAINILTKDLGNAAESSNSYRQTLDGVNASLTDVDGKINTIIETYKKQLKAVKDQEKAEKDLIRTNKQAASQQEKTRQENLRKTSERIKRQDFLNKVDIKNLRDNVDERRKLEREAGIQLPTTLPTAPPAMPMNIDVLQNNAKIAQNALKQINKDANLSTAFDLANSTFFSPISSAFENFLTTGKFAFKDFAQSVLKAISQIVAKVIATGIISLLFTIFTGGFGAGAGGFAGGIAKVGKIVGSSLGFGGASGARVGQPNFGGVSGGGMQMAGAVNLTLRGSDLVGSINRTNATINRVG